MSNGGRRLAIAAAVAASLFCLAGGLWILVWTGFNTGSDATSTGVGLYFIGKAFFVGPLLILTVLREKKG